MVKTAIDNLQRIVNAEETKKQISLGNPEEGADQGDESMLSQTEAEREKQISKLM